jgi:DNA replication and repair protein RecF
LHLQKIDIRDFRCLAECHVEPGPGVNLVVGENASGKTSLLEAIYFLGRARSFRQTPPNRLIRRGADLFTLGGLVASEEGRPQRIGIVRSPGQTRIRLDGRDDAPLLDLVNTLPVQVIDPNLHRLLEEGPKYRRRYLDWGVFHVEHEFFPAWRRYRRALRQRNGALRQGRPRPDVIVWDSELVHAAKEVDACRRSYIDGLARILPEMVGDVLGEGEVALDYRPGWPQDEDYGSALLHSLESDRRAGFTHHGPHRADLRVQVASVTARDWVSRGQQKVLTAALLLAQAALLDRRRGIRPVLLIDDLAAELGTTYRAAMLKTIARLRGQCFLTFLDASLIPDDLGDATMFHVEHGRILEE